MAQRYAFLFFFLLTSFCVSSQKFEGGLQLGLVGSQVAGDTYSGYNKAGINAGGWVSFSVAPKSKFQMELVYIQKGSRENPNYEKNKMDAYLMQLGYAALPVLYRYQYSDFLSFEAGLSLNVLIHQREVFNGGVFTGSPFSTMNICLLAGLSGKVNERLRINIRTDNSLSSIRRNRVTGDVWRLWGHGQFSDALVITAYYKL
ncbi:MAG: PorT family protein [Lentimicrobium sp.]|nr:PorT family protein [Lentimicrobium sp.]